MFTSAPGLHGLDEIQHGPRRAPGSSAPSSAAAVWPRPEAVGPLLQALFDEVDTGIALCDSESRLLVANRCARAELRAGALRLLDGRVRADAGDRWRSALQCAVDGGRRQLLRFGEGTARRLIYLLPMPALAGIPPCAALLFGRVARHSDLALEMLSGVYKLTRSEREVLGGLVAGRRPGSVAKQRGVALSTVRSQIQALRDKLGAQTITELVGMVAAMPPIAGALAAGGLVDDSASGLGLRLGSQRH